jgi:threonine/homoserine/homoserine lactone efflux protein
MLTLTTWLAFCGIALAMVLTPGPNMVYLLSRSICQGTSAGMISLGGIVAGFAIYVVLAAFGMSALFLSVPYAYDALRLAGAAYLAFLAWQALRPNGSSPFEPRVLRAESPQRLFGTGFLTSVLNPKIAMLYFALFPQFIDPAGGDVLTQSLFLGATQIAISTSVNALIVLGAGSISAFLRTRPTWARVQRWIMATTLGFLAARMALDSRR